jgi:hypothetical protein
MSRYSAASSLFGFERAYSGQALGAPRATVALGVLLVLAVAGVASALASPGAAATSQTRFLTPAATASDTLLAQKGLGRTPIGYGAKYDAAVIHMTRINHLLEKRQTELFYARQRGNSVRVIADLRRRVALLERGYADAIVAMGQATR